MYNELSSMQRKELLENLLNDLCGSFLKVVYVKHFEQRHPSHFWINIQADIYCGWGELCLAQHHRYESEQQNRRSHHLSRSSP